jgi:hypothetical protein
MFGNGTQPSSCLLVAVQLKGDSHWAWLLAGPQAWSRSELTAALIQANPVLRSQRHKAHTNLLSRCVETHTLQLSRTATCAA